MELSPFEIVFKEFGTQRADTLDMQLFVDDCMKAVLGETQFSGSVILCYSVCHDDVMKHLCGDTDWPPPMGVVFQTIPAMFKYSISLIHHAL